MKKTGIIFLSLILFSNSLPVMAIENVTISTETTSSESFKEDSQTKTSEMTESSTINSSEIEDFLEQNKEKTPEELYEEIMKLAENAKTPEEYQRVLEYLLENTDYASSGPYSGMMNRASNKQGVAEYLGTTKDRLLRELQSHERDNFYLGTPFRGLVLPSEKVLSPNGAPNRYGPGMNCTGFVATAFRRAGGDLGQITRVANAWGDVGNAYNWRDALTRNTEYYEFSSVSQLLASGKAEKGDVLYFEPNYNIRPYDCHIGFFWGSNSKENKMWHSYDRNIMSNIKSATPWTKIMLFKLGSNKNDIISQTNLNAEKFINTNSAYVYSRPYQTGDAKKMTSNGLKNRQVTVTKQVQNGHGIWQEFKLNDNGNNITGWLRKEEFDNYINKQSYNTKLILKGNSSYVYSDPYYPGVSTLNIMTNKQFQAFSISQKATSGYGEWFYSKGIVDGKSISGWIKSTDFIEKTEPVTINGRYTVNKSTGVIYDKPYTAPNVTQAIGTTTDLYNNSYLFTEVVKTGYGDWYKTILDDGQVGWIKSVDLNFFSDYEKVSGKRYVKQDFGVVYNEPYVGERTKRIEDLINMKNVIFDFTEKATTEYGIWYKGTFIKNGKKITGWVKDTDLNEGLDYTKEAGKLEIINPNGIVYDSPYNEGHTKRIGLTKELDDKIISVKKSVKTPFGLWYETSTKMNGEKITGWIRSSDVVKYSSHEYTEGVFYINKNYGVVYDYAYDGKVARRINTMENMKNVVFDYTEKAETEYGIWYKGTFMKNGKKVTGWVKDTDLDKDYEFINETSTRQIINQDGVIYDSPYNYGHTKAIGITGEVDKLFINVTKSVQTPYGLWYESQLMKNGQALTGWIKSVDLAKYNSHITEEGLLYANKNYGVVYDRAYDGENTKKVNDLINMKNVVVKYTEKAETDYGTWYKGTYYKNNQKVTGWIKSTDLDSNYQSKNINEYKRIIKSYGVIYDSPYNKDYTKAIGSLSDINESTILVTELVETPYGLWYKTTYGLGITGWIKSTDLK